MGEVSSAEVYTAREIALAAGVAEAEVVAALGGSTSRYVPYAEALSIGRMLAGSTRPLSNGGTGPAPLFSGVVDAARNDARRLTTIPMAVSGSAHAVLLVVVFLVTSVGLAPAV